MIGKIFGPYRIESKLGQGGMGIVYKARDTRLDRPVAIKVLPPDKVADPTRKQRFVQEAKAASALNHPNIITIHDISSEHGLDFIVMEYIEGKTLSEIIPPKGLRQSQILHYATQIADGMAKAHSAGILHRDLKPNNLVVTDEGRIKILDFGLAKLINPPDPSTEAATVSAHPLTEEGAVLGTAAYMSPEQAEGHKLDSRSDIFSFGSVLYEMVTGRRPFSAESPVKLLIRILQDDPTMPRELNASISPELEKVILRCLRKDPARRYQTMADLKVALDDLKEESTPQRQKNRTSLLRRLAWGALLLPIFLIAGLFIWRSQRPPESTEPLRAVPLIALPGVVRYPSFSSSGNHVVFTWTGEKKDNPDIYVQQIGAGSPLRLTVDPSNDYNPVWSSDDRWIAFLRSQSEAGNSELRLIPPLGGTERKVKEIRVRSGTFLTPPYLSWCPDSTCLIVTDSPGEGKPDALFVISLETGQKRQLTHPQPPASGDTHPAISPDGTKLVFRRMANLFTGELYWLKLQKGIVTAGEPSVLTRADLDADYPAWIPESNDIIFSARGGLWRLSVGGENKPSRLPFVGEDGLMPAVSRTKPERAPRLVYVRSFSDYNLWRIETSSPGMIAESPPVRSVSSTRSDSMPHLSPDGRRLCFTSDRSGGWEIWTSELDGSNPLQLTFLGARASGYPHWSPDGNRVVFHSNLEGQWDVYDVNASGGKPRKLTSHPSADTFPSYSRDNQWIYFNSNRNGEHHIWKMPANGGDAVQVTKRPGYAPLESPDGSFIYFVETLDAPSPLLRVPLTGGDPIKVLDGVVLANYAVIEQGIYYIERPLGQKGVFYLDEPTSETRLQYFDFATRMSKTVCENLGIVDLPLTTSSDGRTIVYSRNDASVDDLMLVENFK